MRSDNIALRAQNLSKMYKMYQKPADMFWELITGRPHYQEFWALRDISFEIKRGNVVGVIGTNGAGKSTLLKIIADRLDPTGGSVNVNGNVSAILELGTGFNPEYTGRENVHIGALLSGMSHSEIQAKLERIIDFSGIRNFIDQPLKTYSSGMQARLAFSLAVSREFDILIIDEALAAGDAIFANKALRRVKEICDSNATVLFVSHSTDAVRRFCNQAIWIEKGSIVLQGDAETVTKAYDRFVYEQSEQYLQSQTISASDIVDNSPEGDTVAHNPEFFKYGSKEVRITGLHTCDQHGVPKVIFECGEHLEIHIHHEGRLADPDEVIHVGCQIYTPKSDVVYTASSRVDCEKPFAVSEQGVFKIILSPLLLGPGEYLLSPCLYGWHGDDSRWLDFHDRLYPLRVINRERPGQSYYLEHPVAWQYEALVSEPAA